MFRGFFSQILVDLGDLEGDYRVFHLKNDTAQSILALLIASISILGMLRMDAWYFRDRPNVLMLLALYRGGFVFLTVIIIFAITKIHKVRIYDRLVLGWVFC
ncbi:MAG TPA: hypothetical protein VN843_31610, partial [Anaerolineales bacterium]|nr:hypothetical protein [Anaerolineales bacterium]